MEDEDIAVLIDSPAIQYSMWYLMITPWGGSGANHSIVIEFASAFGEYNPDGAGGTVRRELTTI